MDIIEWVSFTFPDDYRCWAGHLFFFVVVVKSSTKAKKKNLLQRQICRLIVNTLIKDSVCFNDCIWT